MSEKNGTATMTAVTEKIPLHERFHVEEVIAQAREVKFSKTLLAVVLGALWIIGVTAAKITKVAWFILAFIAVGIRTGWREARGEPLAQPKLEDVLAENAALRAALDRYQVAGL